MTIVQLVLKIPLLKKITGLFLHKRAGDIVENIEYFLNKDDKVLDLGSGSCHVAKFLKDGGYNITAVDVQDLSYFTEIKSILYDGKELPFSDNEFSVALIITVLHHIKDPISILKETKRVANRIIIEEDIYTNLLQKYFTFFADSLLNFDFFTNPHSNKTDKAWRKEFEELGLKLKDVKYHSSHIFLKHATYLLEK